MLFGFGVILLLIVGVFVERLRCLRLFKTKVADRSGGGVVHFYGLMVFLDGL